MQIVAVNNNLFTFLRVFYLYIYVYKHICVCVCVFGTRGFEVARGGVISILLWARRSGCQILWKAIFKSTD